MNVIYLVLVICNSFSICVANEENRWFDGLFGSSVIFGAHAQLGQLDHGGLSHRLEQNVGHRHHRPNVNLVACECLQVIGQDSAAATTTAAPAMTKTAGSTTTAAARAAITTGAGAPTTATGATTRTTTVAPMTTAPYWSWTTTAAGIPQWSLTPGSTIGYWTTTATRSTAAAGRRRRRAMASNQIPTQDLPDVNDASIERAVLDFYNGMQDQIPQGSHFDGADEYLPNMDLHNDHHHHTEVHHPSQSEEIIPNPGPFVAPAEYVPNTAYDFVNYRRQPGFRNPYTAECICSQVVSISTAGATTTGARTTGTTTSTTTPYPLGF